MMKLTCLVDNSVQFASPLWGEHGLSYLIETHDGRVLFDTGQSGTVLLHNMQAIGIDPGSIDALAISHAHYDHTGGLPVLLERLRPGIPLYANSDLFRARFSRLESRLKSIGLPLTREELESHLTLKLDAAPQEIFAGVWTTGEITERSEFTGSSDQHLMSEGDVLVADEYRDDMSMVLQFRGRLTVLCGCCHAGLLNTLEHVERTFELPITRIIGGTHLVGVSADNLKRCAARLSAMATLEDVNPSHCTGEEAFLSLAQMLNPPKVSSAPAGEVFEIGS